MHKHSDVLRELLNQLSQISARHPELDDTEVRERMFEVVYARMIRPREQYQMPQSVGMFSEQGNLEVLQALETYCVRALPLMDHFTPQQRLDAFQDHTVTSDEGMTPDEFFGYSDSLDEYERTFS